MLWQPSVSQIANAPVEQFRQQINKDFGLSLKSYADLHTWSVQNTESFWASVWTFSNIISEHRGDTVLENPNIMPGAKWFPEAKLNYAQNLLHRSDDATAIIFRSENGDEQQLSYAQLNAQVASLARAFKSAGVVAGYLTVSVKSSQKY